MKLTSDFYLEDEAAKSLARIAEDEGYETIDKLIFGVSLESLQPGRCRSCGFVTTGVEGDSREGWCEGCGKNHVESVAVLAGLL